MRRSESESANGSDSASWKTSRTDTETMKVASSHFFLLRVDSRTVRILPLSPVPTRRNSPALQSSYEFPGCSFVRYVGSLGCLGCTGWRHGPDTRQGQLIAVHRVSRAPAMLLTLVRCRCVTLSSGPPASEGRPCGLLRPRLRRVDADRVRHTLPAADDELERSRRRGSSTRSSRRSSSSDDGSCARHLQR
jgi:hypothetical protein